MNPPVPLSTMHASEAIRVARQIVEGSLGIIEGARSLADAPLYSGHVQQPIDADYQLFLEIDSKTNHLPFGGVRSHWSAEALVTADAEIAEAEARFRERALSAANALTSSLRK